MAKEEEKTRVLIVIDGPNVGMEHSASKWPASSSGIAAAVSHYADLGYDVHAFVPRHFLNDNANRGVDDASILRNLRAKGLVASVPSQDHDDDYWLQFAWQKGAYVVTNDRMKDHAEKFPSEDSEDFFKWRDEKVISYTFVGDDFFPNPSIKIPLVTKNNETINPKKSKEVPSVRKSRAVFRSIIRDRLSKGPVNCGMLASEVNDLFSEKSNHDFKNRKELMKSMNVSKTNFHEQLTELMGDELIVELVKGQPVDVKLVNSSKAKGKNKASNKANKKPIKNNEPSKKTSAKSAPNKRKRMSRFQFKQILGSNEFEKLKVSSNDLPEIVANSLQFLADLEYPSNYAGVGLKFKDKFGEKINSVFTNMDNLIKFMNFRYEIPHDNIKRDGSMLVLEITNENVGIKGAKKMSFIEKIKSLFFKK